MNSSNESDAWDRYWKSGESTSKVNKIYGNVASFYRNRIIGPNLRRKLEHYFVEDATLLHAGCGGGEVDLFVPSSMMVYGIDISEEAIISYKKNNPQFHSRVMSIFDLPSNLPQFDGIYNLGVMEHFSSIEVQQVLESFYLALKPGARVILFWPPKFGLSVIALKIIHFILKLFQGKKFVPLHPDEPNKIGGARSAKKVFENSGFKFEHYSFGIRDAFTYATLVAVKV